jgi:hypothetical protein
MWLRQISTPSKDVLRHTIQKIGRQHLRSQRTGLKNNITTDEDRRKTEIEQEGIQWLTLVVATKNTQILAKSLVGDKSSNDTLPCDE